MLEEMSSGGGTLHAELPWYDTHDGIRDELDKGLAGLRRICKARHQAGYQRGERLAEFVLLKGKIWLDTCGNTQVPVQANRFDAITEIPDVVTRESFLLELQGIEPEPFFSLTLGTLPPTSLVCDRCHCSWDLQNVLDVHQRELEMVRNSSLADYEGSTLGHVIETINGEDPDSNRRRRVELYDLYAQRDLVAEQRETLESELVGRDSVISWREFVYFHSACWAYVRADEERAFFEKVFAEAGFAGVQLLAIPARYPGNVAPWFRAVTVFGDITIGWRKRVISVNWFGKADGNKLFDSENVTKGIYTIHAWGQQKAVEYLRTLREFWVQNGV